MESGNALSSQAVSSSVLSARKGLTSVFGMSLSLLSPEWLKVSRHLHNCLANKCLQSPREIVYTLWCLLWQYFTFYVWLSRWPISIGPLNTLLCLHSRPINLVVFKGSMISNLEVGFTLRCLQRLSHPYFATRLCRWRDNRCTIGTSIPVLSY